MYLGIDLGTSSVKVLLIDANQAVIGSATSPLDVSRPHPGWSEQDPADWIAATEAALADLKAQKPAELSAVKGIGLSGHMHGATLLDRSDQVLRPCILWNDTRSHAEAAKLDADPRFRHITGNIVFPGFTAPKLAWVRNNEPAIFDAVRWVLLPKDFLRLWLTGEHMSEMSDRRARPGSMSQRDAGLRNFLPRRISAKSRCPTSSKARIRPACCVPNSPRKWGMGAGIVVAGGAGDNAASACGMGTVRPGQAFASLGTSGVMFAANGSYMPNPESAVHTFCHALPNTWHQMGVILSATDSLNWLAGITGKKRRRPDRRTRRHAEGADGRQFPALSLR